MKFCKSLNLHFKRNQPFLSVASHSDNSEDKRSNLESVCHGRRRETDGGGRCGEYLKLCRNGNNSALYTGRDCPYCPHRKGAEGLLEGGAEAWPEPPYCSDAEKERYGLLCGQRRLCAGKRPVPHLCGRKFHQLPEQRD